MTQFQDQWWCTFREGTGHAGDDGRVRVITSDDGDRWTSSALLQQPGIDLRDPKLSITPDGRLMLIMGGSFYNARRIYQSRAPRVAFSREGRRWTSPRKLLAEDHWLWRVTWQGESVTASRNWAMAKTHDASCSTALAMASTGTS